MRYIITGEPKKETERIPGPDISHLWDYFIVYLDDKFSPAASILLHAYHESVQALPWLTQ